MVADFVLFKKEMGNFIRDLFENGFSIKFRSTYFYLEGSLELNKKYRG